MIGLLQRVTRAEVRVEGDVVGSIGLGLLVLVAVQPGDSESRAERLLERLLGYRVFPDTAQRMNLSLRDIFTTAASPAEGERLFGYLHECARLAHPSVATGRFGADMQVSLVNDGPVTFWLET
jgi:D-tyrosyl-tRNA(Tyr) deacylase